MRYLKNLPSMRPSREQMNAVIASIALTFALIVTAVLSSLVFLAMPYFALAAFVPTILAGFAMGLTLVFILRRAQTPSRFAMLEKIAIVEGFVALALLPINAGTTFDLIMLLLVAMSYAFTLSARCIRWVMGTGQPPQQ